MTEFGYHRVLKSDESGAVTSLIAYELQVTRPLRAIIWSVPDQDWIYAPAIAAMYLFDPDYQDRSELINRPTAEEIASRHFPKELPSEQLLLTMLDEGEKSGWTWGPPPDDDAAPSSTS